jgi:hypothetical protein
MLGKDLDQSAASPQDVRKFLAHAAKIRQLVRISREQYGQQGTADQRGGRRRPDCLVIFGVRD